MRPARPALPLLLIAVAGCGCAAKRYDVSAVGAPPPAAGRRHGTGAIVELPGLTVAIEALDAVAANRPAVDARAVEAPPLRLRLRLESKEIGYSLDPSAVVLRRGDEEWRASEAQGSGCGGSGVLAEEPGGRLWLGPRACVVLAFDAGVREGAGQVLVLDGLARGSRPLDRVVVPVERRRVTAHELTPAGRKALEVLGYILLAPLAAY